MDRGTMSQADCRCGCHFLNQTKEGNCMNRFWDTWKSSTIIIGKMKATGFGVVFLFAIIMVALLI